MTTEPIPALDDLARIQAIDKRSMLRLVNELPEQCETAMGIARNFSIEPLESAPSVVFITGTGASGIAADMTAAVLSDEIDVPVLSNHGGRLPKFIGENALVIVVDYAGKSSMQARNLRDAKARGTQVICVSSGGKLLEAASRDGIKTVKIPPGQPYRSAIGYLFVPIVTVIEKLGISSGLVEKLSSAIKLMKNVREQLRVENPTTRNSAKQTAHALVEKLPVIYGAPGYREVIADRWKSQINANSKCLACVGRFPDAAEGDISGLEFVEKQCRNTAIIMLKDSNDRSEITDLMNASAEVLAKFDVMEIDIKGNTIIEKLLYGVYFGDFVSCYLALLYEVNPSTTEYVSLLEAKFSGEPTL